MSRRQIRLRPVRRDQVDLRRLAAAVAAMAAEQRRQEKAKKPKSAPQPKPDHKEAA